MPNKDTSMISPGDDSAKPAELPLPCRRLLSIPQAAEYIGIKPRLFATYIDCGLIVPVRVGGLASTRPRKVIDVTDLDTLIEQLKLHGDIDAVIAARGSAS